MANALEFEFSSESECSDTDEECVVVTTPHDLNGKFMGVSSKPKIDINVDATNATNAPTSNTITANTATDQSDQKTRWPGANDQYGRTTFQCHVTEQALMSIAQSSNQAISSETYEVLREALLRHPMFSSLANVPNVLNMIMRVVHRSEIKAGLHLWNEGDAANELFFVESGVFHYFNNARFSPPISDDKNVSTTPTAPNVASSTTAITAASTSTNTTALPTEASTSSRFSVPRQSLTLSEANRTSLGHLALATSSSATIASEVQRHPMTPGQPRASLASPKSTRATYQANIFSNDASNSKTNNTPIEHVIRKRANSSHLSAGHFSSSQDKPSWTTPRNSLVDRSDEVGGAASSGKLNRGVSWVKMKLEHTRSIPNLIGNYNAVAPYPGPDSPQARNGTSFGFPGEKEGEEGDGNRSSEIRSNSITATSYSARGADTSKTNAVNMNTSSPPIASSTADLTTSAACNSIAGSALVSTNTGTASENINTQREKQEEQPVQLLRVQGQGLTGEFCDTVGAGDTVGDHALFFGVPRANTLVCVEDAVLWRLDAIVFRHFIALADSTGSEGFGDALKEHPSFQNLPEAKLTLVGKSSTVVHFPPGQHIVKVGEKCDYVYLIQSGRVRNLTTDTHRRISREISNTLGGEPYKLKNNTTEIVEESKPEKTYGGIDFTGKKQQQYTGIDFSGKKKEEKKEKKEEEEEDANSQTSTVVDEDEDFNSSTRDLQHAVKDALEEIVVTEGQTFGAKLLALDRPSRYDSFAESDDLFCIQVPVECLKNHLTTEELQRGAKLTALKSVPIFSRLPASDIQKLESTTEQVHFTRGTKIVTKGEHADKMFVISQGQCLLDSGPAVPLEIDMPSAPVVGSAEMVVSMASVGDSFGEEALLAELAYHTQDVYAADDDVSCWVFFRDEFVKTIALSANTKKQLKEHIVHRVLQRVPILNTLRANKLRQVSAVFEQKSYTDGQYIVKEGAPGTDFYVIWNGTIRVTKSTSEKGVVHLCDIHGGDFFGEMALLTNGLRTASCAAVGDVICFTISQSSFTRMVGDDLLPAMQMQATNRIAYTTKTLQNAYEKLLDDMKLKDLQMIRPIGKGGFGFVQLVKYATDGSMYALKQINKQRAISGETSLNVEKIIVEKNALFDIRHPFAVRPIKTFVDERNMYVLMELIEAGELYEVIQNKRNKTRNRDTALKAPQARFYAACVISVLSYMHQRRYIYRDLKPENLMIDLQGYIKVIDFGLVKRHLNPHTYTFCGTPEYLAPEIVCGKGYSFGVDWWSLGILIYEMLVGITPFRGESSDSIMQTILTGEFQFPASFKDNEAKDLINALLCSDPTKRLGYQRNGGAEVKAHKWFSAVNWKGILDRHVKAPWTPKFKKDGTSEGGIGADASSVHMNNVEASEDLPCPPSWKPEWDESWLNIARQHQMWTPSKNTDSVLDLREEDGAAEQVGVF